MKYQNNLLFCHLNLKSKNSKVEDLIVHLQVIRNNFHPKNIHLRQIIVRVQVTRYTYIYLSYMTFESLLVQNTKNLNSNTLFISTGRKKNHLIQN